MDRHELRARRLALRLSQLQLAALLDVTKDTISRWERGAVPLNMPGMLHWALRGLERAHRRPPPVRRRGPMRAPAAP